jgi:hypothetical protein
MNLFKQLEDLRNEYEDRELTNIESDKLNGECRPGCKVEIHWVTEYGTKIIDNGYVFVVDGMDAEIGDCFVHVPDPDNPGGKDVAPPEFTYMIALQTNPFVKKIVCK